MSLAEAIPSPPFKESPFKWRLAVRACEPEQWLQVDDAREADLVEKDRILATRFAESVAWVPGSEPAAAEVAGLVDADLARRGVRVPPETARSTDAPHPIERAARSVQEDLCVLERQPEGWVLTSAAVCFPTRWDLAEKIGTSMAAIHVPVPRYEADVGELVDRFFDRMRPGSIVWRPNWSLVTDPALRLEVEHREAPAPLPADPGESLWLRMERQTLRRLVDNPDAICFTIRIHRWPVHEVIETVADAGFVAELAAMPIDVADYKNVEGMRHDLLDWIAARGSQ